jgi:hypothetical protein
MKTVKALKSALCISLCCFPITNFSANDQPLTDIACRYEMRITPHDKSQSATNKTWFFWRNASMVQTQDADGDHGEIWQRTATGNIQYRKLYHRDKTAVEYMPADNVANNMNFDWFKLSSMLSQQELNALKPIKTLQVMGKNAELRTGTVNGQSVEVQWLVDEHLPASIIKKDSTQTVELHLSALSPLTSTQQKPVTIADIANYRQIDAVDFGDMENDPFVKKILAGDGHHNH